MPAPTGLLALLSEDARGKRFRRYFYRTAGVLLVLALLAGYDLRVYKNFSGMEAMDASQLARNIAKGHGYTTEFVRPFSMYLLQKGGGSNADRFRIRGQHPDISNPPLYPLALAGAMSVLPFRYETERGSWPWTVPQQRLRSADDNTPMPRFFQRYQPEFLIALFNQALFAGCIILTFFLARKLFDPTIAWISAVLMLGTELLWRFSTSGLSTMLLMGVFLGLAWTLVLLEEALTDTARPAWRSWLLAAVAGALLGLGGLTRYSFGWLIVPLVAWLAILGRKHRWPVLLAALVAFLVVFTPWLIRNFRLTGTPFGTATYTLIEGTPVFPEFQLQRSLEPALGQDTLRLLTRKLVINGREVVRSDLPQLGGTWLSAFFLAGLLVHYRKRQVRRLRLFAVGSLLVFAVVQALGKTHTSEVSPVVNNENLLVLLTPLMIVYGVSLFFLLLDTVEFSVREFRPISIGLFGTIASLPLILALLPPANPPLAWPPYYPPVMEKAASWMKPGELTMSDIPWAIAWYGDRQSAWLTLNPKQDFLAINDYRKPVKLLLLSRPTMDSKIYADIIREGNSGWGELLLECLLRKEVPAGFPLKSMAPGYFPEFLVLTDWARWVKPGETPKTPDLPKSELPKPSGPGAPRSDAIAPDPSAGQTPRTAAMKPE